MEERVLELLNYINKKYPNEKNLCLSGGFFMNSVLNGKIKNNTNFNEPHIGPCPDDTGISIGSAFISSAKKIEIPIKKYYHNYFGSNFSNEEIKSILDISKIQYEEISNHLQDAAKFLSEGKIVGWFQGSSELGQRALGNRSILASPTFSGMKDEINKYVKFREEFRPFAPSILDEFKNEFFELTPETEVYFMEKVLKFKDKVVKKVPAVVHNDGTGRIHIVSEKSNKIFYELLKEFYSITNIPILLNTSFNTNNVPIVNSPKDALGVFYNSGIDILYMNNIKISK
jgi:carbamoyltransferase